MKILVIIPNDLDEPSTRFRIVQYEALLKQEGVEIEYISRGLIRKKISRSYARRRCYFQ